MARIVEECTSAVEGVGILAAFSGNGSLMPRRTKDERAGIPGNVQTGLTGLLGRSERELPW
jgi:hypothetical protein